MAIQTMDDLIAALASVRRQNIYKVSTVTEGSGTFHSLIKVSGYPTSWGGTPATGAGEIPTKDSGYGLALTNAASGHKNYIARTSFACNNPGTLIIYDRLWHNSGLSGIATTPQTVNSTPLTRYTDGLGVEIFAEVYTVMGATASTFTVNYTDANNAAASGTYTMPANALTVGQMVQFIPNSGFIGAKSIQNITLSASTGTQGNFGLVMLRRLAEIPLNSSNLSSVLDSFSLGMPDFQDNACLCFMLLCSTTTTGALMGAVDIVEG